MNSPGPAASLATLTGDVTHRQSDDHGQPGSAEGPRRDCTPRIAQVSQEWEYHDAEEEQEQQHHGEEKNSLSAGTLERAVVTPPGPLFELRLLPWSRVAVEAVGVVASHFAEATKVGNGRELIIRR